MWRLLIDAQVTPLKAAIPSNYYQDLLARRTTSSTLDPAAKQVRYSYNALKLICFIFLMESSACVLFVFKDTESAFGGFSKHLIIYEKYQDIHMQWRGPSSLQYIEFCEIAIHCNMIQL